MMQSGKMDKKSILSMRDKMSDTIDAMGSSLVKSMGVAYAVSCDKAAGIDVDHIQKSYLLFAGLKMLGMALLMGVVTVLVGFFASRVGAGIGMTLREKYLKMLSDFQMLRWISSQLHHLSREVQMTSSRYRWYR